MYVYPLNIYIVQVGNVRLKHFYTNYCRSMKFGFDRITYRVKNVVPLVCTIFHALLERYIYITDIYTKRP